MVIFLSITSFGFFVSLPNTIEGLVHMTSLTDDYYAYDEKNLILSVNIQDVCLR